jgi:hypothetical protein
LGDGIGEGKRRLQEKMMGRGRRGGKKGEEQRGDGG